MCSVLMATRQQVAFSVSGHWQETVETVGQEIVRSTHSMSHGQHAAASCESNRQNGVMPAQVTFTCLLPFVTEFFLPSESDASC